jgi:hypothetical protein
MITTLIILLVGAGIAWQARRNMTFSVIALQLFLLVVVCIGAFKLESRQDDLGATQKAIVATQKAIVTTQDQVRQERIVRSHVQAEINRYVCSENNKQDRLLASLLDISLRGADDSTLTPEQEEALVVFLRVLRDLRNEAPCQAIVQAFLEASDTNDLKEIRRILQTAASAKAPEQKTK